MGGYHRRFIMGCYCRSTTGLLWEVTARGYHGRLLLQVYCGRLVQEVTMGGRLLWDVYCRRLLWEVYCGRFTMGGYCNGFEITFVSEKHMVEDDILFTNHLVRK